MSRRLIIGAHADDETIGCGATLAKYAERGVEHFVGILTRDRGDEQHERRMQEAHAAWELLGVRSHAWADLREHPLPREREAVDAIAGWLDSFRPDLVLVPHPGEKDRDHAAVGDAVHDAMALTGWWPPLLGYEVWTPLQEVHVIEQVDATIERKVQAIQCYRSQLEANAYDDGALALARYRGVMTGRGKYAEVFTVIGR
ncbi:PIG-L family deacetylase [Propioniciclava sp. MC1683]|uniref:PIG-L deacetylase family protein n=1 Tax=Propioniciclava sp. MC1683 TaxID=2760309 RepID=UPI0015FFD55D|nr:PIG-L family deacetylase [Propioniciclava sp. MC1683]MBB1501868.1 PIG-L family deacetylase [Propioniciclava sp. MC1683]